MVSLIKMTRLKLENGGGWRGALGTCAVPHTRARAHTHTPAHTISTTATQDNVREREAAKKANSRMAMQQNLAAAAVLRGRGGLRKTPDKKPKPVRLLSPSFFCGWRLLLPLALA